MVHEIDPTVPVLIFQDFFNREHRKWVGKVIKDRNLVAFFYRPTVVEYKLGSIISLYPFGARSLPVISDVVHSDECGLDWGKRVLDRTPLAVFPWDLILLGSRKSDSHKLVPVLDFSALSHVACPIWEMSDSDVHTALLSRGIKTSPTSSDAHLCMNCLEPEGRSVYCAKLGRNIDTIGGL